eukprot:jgi/Ulvmu1/4829/UM020_0115.1
MADVFSTLRRKRLYLLIFCFFLWMAAAGVLIPHITPISVDYFAAVKGGDGIKCDGDVSYRAQAQSHNSTEAPHLEACRLGSRTAVSWVAITAFFQNGLAFVVSPLVGWASDGLGRKPFFAASQVAAVLPALWIGLYLRFGAMAFPFPMYYVLDALKGSLNPLAIVMSAVADVAEGHLRATIYSLLMVTMSIAMIIAAGVGGLLSASMAGQVSVGIYAANLLLITCALPETLSEENRQSVKEGRQRASSMGSWCSQMAGGLRETLAVLRRSELFAKLAIVMMVSGIVFECIQDLLFNYLIITMGFAASDNARILIVIGICGLGVQGLLLPALLKWVRQERILVSAVIASTLEMAGFAIAPVLGPWSVYAAVAIGSPGSMAFPVISALKSVHAGEEEQGRVQGALFAAKAIATGLGPLGFSAVFNYTTEPKHYAPSAAIWGLSVVMALGAIVAATIRVPAPPAEHPQGSAAEATGDDKGGTAGEELDDEHAQLLGKEHAYPANPVDLVAGAVDLDSRGSIERESVDASSTGRPDLDHQ